MSVISITRPNANNINKTDLLSLTLPEMQEWLVERGEPPFRAKQLYSWLYRHLVTRFSAMTNLPQALRDPLAQEASIGPLVVRNELHSQHHLTRKILFRRERGGVRWPAEGLPGSASIHHITTIFLMGMGEPLHNYDNVLRALRILNSPDGFNLGARHMTVSTVGLVPAIRKLSQEPLQVNLAISLHAPTDELRSQTMPVNKKYPLLELLSACRDYIDATGRQVTFEYVLLAGVNDTAQSAHQLGELLAPLKQFAHVNCIPVNPTSSHYHPPHD